MSTTDSMKFPMLFHWGAGIFSCTWHDLPGQKDNPGGLEQSIRRLGSIRGTGRVIRARAALPSCGKGVGVVVFFWQDDLMDLNGIELQNPRWLAF